GLGGGAVGQKGVLAALTGDGTKKWSLELGGHVNSAQAAFEKPWLAVGMKEGTVHVVDIANGKVIAGLDGQGALPEVAWLAGEVDAPPMLPVVTGDRVSRLTAYRVTKEQ